jgi:hypothetical protein
MHALAEHTRKRFHHLLSIHGINFIACLVYAERIFASFYMSIQIHAG